jgi:flagellar biosynthesis chaperone FliJ
VMGTYRLEQVIQMWETEKLTTEQAIGQILLHLQTLAQQVRELEHKMQERAGRKPAPPPQRGTGSKG